MIRDYFFDCSSDTRIGYCRYGVNNGLPAFFFHGLPGSRREGRLIEQACIDNNINLIAPDRFGYGISSQTNKNRYTAWVECVERLADHLKFENFYLVAVSGGVPYALACASLLKQRVIATSVCGGLASVAVEMNRKAMAGYEQLAFTLARKHPLLFITSYGLLTSIPSRLLPSQIVRLLGLVNGEPDKTVLSDEAIRRKFADNIKHAYAQYWHGGMADLIAATESWPFELNDIKNLHIWHGDEDPVVPPPHSLWLHDQVAGSYLTMVEGEGHFSLPLRYADQIIKSLFLE